jgi:hypothetical protein
VQAGDVALVSRAVVNGWVVPTHVQRQISEQMEAALSHFTNLNSHRQVQQLLRIVNLMVRMDGRDMVDEGRAAQSDFSYLRRRQSPESLDLRPVVVQGDVQTVWSAQKRKDSHRCKSFSDRK